MMNKERWKFKGKQKDSIQKSLISFLSVKPRKLPEVKADQGNKNSSLGERSESRSGTKRACPFYKKIPGRYVSESGINRFCCDVLYNGSISPSINIMYII